MKDFAERLAALKEDKTLVNALDAILKNHGPDMAMYELMTATSVMLSDLVAAGRPEYLAEFITMLRDCLADHGLGMELLSIPVPGPKNTDVN